MTLTADAEGKHAKPEIILAGGMSDFISEVLIVKTS